MSFSSIKQWVELFRDIGLIFGVPGIIILGYKLFNRHIVALKDAHKAHIDALESENRLLKEPELLVCYKLRKNCFISNVKS